MLVLVHVVSSYLVRVVPPWISYAVVAWAAPLVVDLFARGHRARAEANMRQVLGREVPAAEVRRHARAAFRNYARYMVDLLRLPNLDRQQMLAQIEVQGWENVEAAYGMGGGVVFVTGHIGNWDMAATGFMTRTGRPVSVLVETLRPPAWNERVVGIRQRLGMRTIPIESGVREMLGALRRKEGLALLADRPVGQEGVTVTFFGARTSVPGGAATLALRTGSPVVPIAVIRKPRGGGFVALLCEPLVGRSTGDTAADVQDLTQRFMAALEAIIRRDPTQWYMFRHMWPASGAEGTRLARATTTSAAT